MRTNTGLLIVHLKTDIVQYSVLYMGFVANFVQAPVDPHDLYCSVCDLALTSQQHAQQHYMGRNHQRALEGHAPLKAGYFNKETGRWQRS